MRIDPLKSIAAIDCELRGASDPWKRSMLVVYRKHTILEITGRLDALMETVAPAPTYEFHGGWAGAIGTKLNGFAEVREYYRRNIDRGAMVGQFESARLAVADWGIVTDGRAVIQTPGALLAEEDPGRFEPQAHYAVGLNIAVFVLFERTSGLISGEIVYTSPPTAIEKMPPGDVMNYEQVAKLFPSHPAERAAAD